MFKIVKGIGVLVSVFIFFSIGYIFIYKSSGIRNLPEGEFLMEVKSPSEKQSIKIYRTNGGATVDFAIRGELVNKKGLKKNIYWEYRKRDANVEWLNEEEVKINDKKIDVNNEVYDWRVD